MKKPFNTLELSILGIIAGICLGIITVLVVTAVNLAYDELPDWEITKWAFSLYATYFGLAGAGFGGIVGFYIGVIRWAKERERQGESGFISWNEQDSNGLR